MVSDTSRKIVMLESVKHHNTEKVMNTEAIAEFCI